jgi:hypothetical protein
LIVLLSVRFRPVLRNNNCQQNINIEMNLIEIPTDLKKLVANEKIDFCVKAKNNYPKSKSYGIILFGIVWTAFISIFVIAFFGPLFLGKEVHFKTNDEPTVGSIDNWEPLLVPGLIIGLFVIVGLSMLVWGFYTLFQNGGYFVGTETRLIKYLNNKITITDWEQFSGNIELNNKNNLGDIEFQLRTGKMESRKNSPDKFVPDIIYISGINDVLEIEKSCRIRIKENDPTPVIVNQ